MAINLNYKQENISAIQYCELTWMMSNLQKWMNWTFHQRLPRLEKKWSYILLLTALSQQLTYCKALNTAYNTAGPNH